MTYLQNESLLTVSGLICSASLAELLFRVVISMAFEDSFSMPLDLYSICSLINVPCLSR